MYIVGYMENTDINEMRWNLHEIKYMLMMENENFSLQYELATWECAGNAKSSSVQYFTPLGLSGVDISQSLMSPLWRGLRELLVNPSMITLI